MEQCQRLFVCSTKCAECGAYLASQIARFTVAIEHQIAFDNVALDMRGIQGNLERQLQVACPVQYVQGAAIIPLRDRNVGQVDLGNGEAAELVAARQQYMRTFVIYRSLAKIAK